MSNVSRSAEAIAIMPGTPAGDHDVPQPPSPSAAPPVPVSPTSAPVAMSWLPIITFAALSALALLVVARTINCTAAASGIGASCVPHVPTVKAGDAVSFATLQAQLAWGVSVLLAVLTSATTLAFAIWTTAVSSPRRTQRPLQAALITLVLALVWHQTRDGADPYSFAFNAHFLGPTVYRTGDARVFVGLVESMGWAALVALAVGVSLVLRSAVLEQYDASRTIEIRALQLARRIRYIRTALLLGSIALVAGAIESGALYTWAGSMLTDAPGSRVPYFGTSTGFASTLGLMTGALYSMMLAAVFAPALLIIRHLAERLADDGVSTADAGERTSWMTARGLHGSIPSKLTAALSLLAPALAGGPLLKLFEVVTTP